MDFIHAWDGTALYPVSTQRRKLLIDAILSLPDYSDHCQEGGDGDSSNAVTSVGKGVLTSGDGPATPRLPTDAAQLIEVGPLLFVRMLGSIKRSLTSCEPVDLELRVLIYLLRRHGWSSYVAPDRTWGALRLIVAVLTSRRKGSEVDKVPALELVKQILLEPELINVFAEARGVTALAELAEYSTEDTVARLACDVLYTLGGLPGCVLNITMSIQRLLNSPRSFTKYCGVDLCKQLWACDQRRYLFFSSRWTQQQQPQQEVQGNGNDDEPTRWILDVLPQLTRFLFNAPILYQFETAELISNFLTVDRVRVPILQTLLAMITLRFIVGGSSLVRCKMWAFSDVGVLGSAYDTDAEVADAGGNERRAGKSAWALLQRSMRGDRKSLTDVIRDAKTRRTQNSGMWSEDDADQHPEMVALYILLRFQKNFCGPLVPIGLSGALVQSLIDVSIPRALLFTLLAALSKLSGAKEYRKLRHILVHSDALMLENILAVWSESDDVNWRMIRSRCSIYSPRSERVELSDDMYVEDGCIRFFMNALLLLDGLIASSEQVKRVILQDIKDTNLSYIIEGRNRDLDARTHDYGGDLMMTTFFRTLLRLALEESVHMDRSDAPMAPSPMSSPQVSVGSRKRTTPANTLLLAVQNHSPAITSVVKEKDSNEDLFVRKRVARLPLPVYHASASASKTSSGEPVAAAVSETKTTQKAVLSAIESLRKQLKGNALIAQLKSDLMRALQADTVDYRVEKERDKLDAAASRVRSTLVNLAKDKELHESGLMSSVMRRKSELIMKLAPVTVAVDKGANKDSIMKGGVVSFHDFLNSAVSFTNDQNRLVRKKYFDNIKTLGVKLEEAELLDGDAESDEEEESALEKARREGDEVARRRAEIKAFMRRDATKKREAMNARLEAIRKAHSRGQIVVDTGSLAFSQVPVNEESESGDKEEDAELESPTPRPPDDDVAIRSLSTRPKVKHRKYKNPTSNHSQEVVRTYLAAERNNALTSSDVFVRNNASDISALQAQIYNLFDTFPESL